MKVSNEMPSRTDQDSVCALTGRFQSLKGQLIDCSSHSLTLSTFWKIVFKEFTKMMRILHEKTLDSGSRQYTHWTKVGDQHPEGPCVSLALLSSLHITYRS